MGELDSQGEQALAARWIALLGGPAAGVLVYLILWWTIGGTPEDSGREVLGEAARRTAGVVAWMAVWWLSEALPLAATALVPLVAFPLLRIMPIKEAAAPFGDELIFLFLGGFFIQLAMERWGLHRRLALLIIVQVGTSPARLAAGVMLATAFISMWISNAAAAAMMLPIGSSLCQLVAAREQGGVGAGDVAGSPHRHVRNLGKCVMIGIAWGATIGGIATPIGTAPNVLLRAYLREHAGGAPSFGTWMLVCGPLALVLLALAWVLLTQWAFPLSSVTTSSAPRLVPSARAARADARAEAGLLRAELHMLGPISPGEWATLVVFGLAVVGWLGGEAISGALGLMWTSPGVGGAPGKSTPLLGDSVVAMAAGLLLFVIPVSTRRPEFALDWRQASKAPYGVLLLFGGGLSLAKAIDVTGLDDAIGRGLIGVQGMHPLAIMLIVALVAVFLSEFMSNTALTATLLPIVGGLAAALGVAPVSLLLPLALAASCAFMLPAGTPPSAITFSSGYYSIRDMAKTGLLLDAAGVVLISVVVYACLAAF